MKLRQTLFGRLLLVFMVFGAVFTLSGGVRAAIYSDVIQVGVYLGAAVVIIAS